MREVIQPSGHVVLVGAGSGAVIATQMVTLDTGRYPELVLSNPELALTNTMVTQPNIVTRALATTDHDSPETAAFLWSVSPMMKHHDIRSNVLLLTSRDQGIIVQVEATIKSVTNQRPIIL